MDGAPDALLPDPALAVETLSGSKVDEAALVARSPGGARASLLFGDTVMNVPRLPELEGFLLGLIGSTGGPRVTRLTRLLTVGDCRALAAHLERLAATPGLVRLVPSHGAIVSEHAGDVLREVAARLR